jgi:hypothetical protein
MLAPFLEHASSALTQHDWDVIDNITEAQENLVLKKASRKWKDKSECLSREQKLTGVLYQGVTVNLSGKPPGPSDGIHIEHRSQLCPYTRIEADINHKGGHQLNGVNCSALPHRYRTRYLLDNKILRATEQYYHKSEQDTYAHYRKKRTSYYF